MIGDVRKLKHADRDSNGYRQEGTRPLIFRTAGLIWPTAGYRRDVTPLVATTMDDNGRQWTAMDGDGVP